MKKLFKGLALSALVLFLAACGGSSTPKDGYYQAAGTVTSSGWTYYMTFEVVEGKMTKVDYNGVNLRDGVKYNKVTESEEGRYKLAPGNAGEWHVQAALINKFIEENQGVAGITFNDEGKSDAIAGATIHYDDTAKLIEDALAAGPVEQGTLTDGIYYKAETKADDKGYTYTFGYFVNHGVILTAHADAFQIAKEDGKEVKQFKTTLSKDGKYDLGADAVAPYHEQALAVAKFLIDNGSFDGVSVNDEGKTDAITGATVSVDRWIALFNELAK